MKMNVLVAAALAMLAQSAFANTVNLEEKNNDYSLLGLSFDLALAAPAKIEKDSFLAWSKSINATENAFADYLFDWFESEKGRDLPPQVYNDAEKMYVSVESPLRQTIELEEAGTIEEGVTYGSEIYAKIPANINQVLETILYRWGKPVGKASGTTAPADTVYGKRVDSIVEKWGPGAYLSITKRTNGGIARDMNDQSLLLVRGNEKDGYDIIGQFIQPNGNTTTTSSMSLMILRALPDGTTSYKLSGRHLGQNYTFLGNVSIGRNNFGFNVGKYRQGQKDFQAMVDELKRTGNIKDRK
jgi:hypothetical protein